MKISLVVSTRNNLKYLKWSYDSIRKNQGNHEVHICYGIDHCIDGTQEWIDEIKKTDPFVKSIENTTGKRLGHTIMYDRIINEIVETDLAMIFHSDMYLCPNALDEIEKLMYTTGWISRENLVQDKLAEFELELGETLSGLNVTMRNKNRIVSLTRIEPPLHLPGREKIVIEGPLGTTEPEDFEKEEETFLHFLENNIKKDKYMPNAERITNGVFAPWAFFADEFKKIGGHDPLFAPQSKEDSDIFNRFKLAGFEFIQTWEGFVYHLTCRGSRFNPNLTTVGKNSPEWEEQNMKSTRNFIRKWGSMVRHDEYLHPIIPHKYHIGFTVKNCTLQLLQALEIWCDVIFTDLTYEQVSEYISMEQPNTQYRLTNRILNSIRDIPDVTVEIDGSRFDQNDYNIICNLSDILTDSGEVGEMEVGNLKLNIRELTHYEDSLILCNVAESIN